MNLRKICKVTSTALLNRQDKLLGVLSIQQSPQVSSTTLQKKYLCGRKPLLPATSSIPAGRTRGKEQAPLLCRPPEAPSPSAPRVYEDPPRVFTVTTSLKELVPSLF